MYFRLQIATGIYKNGDLLTTPTRNAWFNKLDKKIVNRLNIFSTNPNLLDWSTIVTVKNFQSSNMVLAKSVHDLDTICVRVANNK